MAAGLCLHKWRVNYNCKRIQTLLPNKSLLALASLFLFILLRITVNSNNTTKTKSTSVYQKPTTSTYKLELKLHCHNTRAFAPPHKPHRTVKIIRDFGRHMETMEATQVKTSYKHSIMLERCGQRREILCPKYIFPFTFTPKNIFLKRISANNRSCSTSN